MYCKCLNPTHRVANKLVSLSPWVGARFWKWCGVDAISLLAGVPFAYVVSSVVPCFAPVKLAHCVLIH